MHTTDRDGTTGVTFFGVLLVLQEYTPNTFLLENGMGLAVGGMCDQVLQELRASGSGYFVYSWVHTPLDYGLLQSRPRFYFLGIRLDLLAEAHITPDVLAQRLETSLRCFRRDRPLLDINDFLLPDEHSAVQRALASARAKNELR